MYKNFDWGNVIFLILFSITIAKINYEFGEYIKAYKIEFQILTIIIILISTIAISIIETIHTYRRHRRCNNEFIK